MNKKIRNGILILIIVLLSILVLWISGISNVYIEKLIVVNVKEKTLQTIDFENKLYIVSVKNEDMSKFKRGQEIKVYFDGIIDTSYPGIIRADKIKISKEKTNKGIPTDVLRHYSYSQNNISVQIKELSNKNIVFEIIDSNEIPLEYGNDYGYTIFKKNNEEVKII